MSLRYQALENEVRDEYGRLVAIVTSESPVTARDLAEQFQHRGENTKPKTRGEEVAEKTLTTSLYALHFNDPSGTFNTIVKVDEVQDISVTLPSLRGTFAKIIDAEIAREREACFDAVGAEKQAAPSVVWAVFDNALNAIRARG